MELKQREPKRIKRRSERSDNPQIESFFGFRIVSIYQLRSLRPTDRIAILRPSLSKRRYRASRIRSFQS